jgi:hypothetical protein
MNPELMSCRWADGRSGAPRRRPDAEGRAATGRHPSDHAKITAAVTAAANNAAEGAERDHSLFFGRVETLKRGSWERRQGYGLVKPSTAVAARCARKQDRNETATERSHTDSNLLHF